MVASEASASLPSGLASAASSFGDKLFQGYAMPSITFDEIFFRQSQLTITSSVHGPGLTQYPGVRQT